jgi:squalene-hopene/tetraprenyl-beta-curcumene cyclase
MRLQKVCLIMAALFVFASFAHAEEQKTYAENWKKAVEFLKKSQKEDGSWGDIPGKVGVTAVVLEALTMAPENIKTESREICDKAAKYLVGQQHAEGRLKDAITDNPDYGNYCTSLAVTALSKFDKTQYEPQITKAVAWIKDQQCTKEKGYDPKKHSTYGGFGYGSSSRPDMSNTWIALDALKAAGITDNDPVWETARTFIKHCQNSTEVNDLDPNTVGNDGGGKYLPVDHEDGSPAGTEKTRDGKTIRKSYGSISYGMLLSYLWCDVKKDDLPVKLVVKWLGENYSVDKNPNTGKEGQEGIYYYYRVMAKSLSAYGEKKLNGKDWAADLAAAIAKRQLEDGSWSNKIDRWSEGDPCLATGYNLSALALAEQMLAKK